MAKTPLTRSRITADLTALGVALGDILEVHAALRSVGPVVGGADAVVLALTDAVGPAGTIVAVTATHDDSYEMAKWPTERQQAYRNELPAFDPAWTSASGSHGRLPERIRTWPGALRSAYPEASVAAVGGRAAWIVEPHDDDFAFGLGTPYERIKQAGGKVLMLGAPLSTITMLHHAESLCEVPGKRTVTYEMPVMINSERVWRQYHDIESADPGAYPYERLDLGGVDPFQVIALGALAAGVGTSGRVGCSTAYLFPARALVDFGMGWIAERFG